MRQQLDVAIRHSLAEQARNRLAWVLLIAFVPGWYLIIGSMMRHTGAPFLLRATGTVLVVDGHDLTLITAGLSAITLITGFVVFAATRRALPFDRRLILSGYRPGALIAAKTTAALAVAAAVGAYAALVILAFWRPAGLWAIALAFIMATATYAALGLLIGVLVRGDLEGFFLIIMLAMLDTFLENPVDNPLANKPILEFFPSYGPDPVRGRGRVPPPGAGRDGPRIPGLDGRLRPARPGRSPPPHAAPPALDPPRPPAGRLSICRNVCSNRWPHSGSSTHLTRMPAHSTPGGRAGAGTRMVTRCGAGRPGRRGRLRGPGGRRRAGPAAR